VSLALWLLLTGLLALYVAEGASFGTTYGPLTGIFALLLWANLSSLALFLGIAFAAQLEAVRAGVPAPVSADPLTTEGASDAGGVLERRTRSGAGTPQLRHADRHRAGVQPAGGTPRANG
jgi:uncharacterized BrkB/YihY/UPF0761 family membrane protein